MKPSYARHRTDSTAKAMEAEAKRLGVRCAPLGGVCDAIWWLGTVSRLIDYKTPNTSLTEAQSRLVANGCPLVFVSDVEQVRVVVDAMKRDAHRTT
jgi:tRNA A58 N-methylase Trm61